VLWRGPDGWKLANVLPNSSSIVTALANGAMLVEGVVVRGPGCWSVRGLAQKSGQPARSHIWWLLVGCPGSRQGGLCCTAIFERWRQASGKMTLNFKPP